MSRECCFIDEMKVVLMEDDVIIHVCETHRSCELLSRELQPLAAVDELSLGSAMMTFVCHVMHLTSVVSEWVGE